MADSKTPITDVQSYAAFIKDSLANDESDSDSKDTNPEESGDTSDAKEDTSDESDEQSDEVSEEDSQEEKSEESEEKDEEPKESKLDLHKTIARKEKEWVTKEKGYKAETNQLKSAVQQYEQFVKAFQKDPFAVLEKFNPNAYEEWTYRKLGKEPPQKQASNDPEVVKLRQQVETLTQAEQARAAQAAIQNYTNSVYTLAQAEDYALAREYCEAQGSDLWTEVTTFADNYAKQNRVVLEPEVALKYMNDYLLKELDFAESVKAKKQSKKEPAKTEDKEEKPRDDKGKFKPKSISNTMKSGSNNSKKQTIKSKEEYQAFIKESLKD